MSLPSAAKIFQYWKVVASTYGLEDHICDDESCFACGAIGVERAHIVSRALGGSNSVANLVLLCKRCHRLQAPDTGDLDDMILFIKNQEPWMVTKGKAIKSALESDLLKPVLEASRETQIAFLKAFESHMKTPEGFGVPHSGIITEGLVKHAILRFASRWK